jgi:hypothetical protein
MLDFLSLIFSDNAINEQLPLRVISLTDCREQFRGSRCDSIVVDRPELVSIRTNPRPPKDRRYGPGLKMTLRWCC